VEHALDADLRKHAVIGDFGIRLHVHASRSMGRSRNFVRRGMFAGPGIWALECGMAIPTIGRSFWVSKPA
jgi:hypothetical protein